MPNPYSQLQASDYQDAALNLLPPGKAWPRALQKVIAQFWGGVADTLFRFHTDAATIVDLELFAPTTAALLPEWENDYGLPDPCAPQPQTVEQRVAALVARRTEIGSLSRQFYIDLAAALGFPITITEFRPMTCRGKCTDPIVGQAWRYAWQVNAPAVTVTSLSCRGSCTSPLRSWGNEPLECAIRRRNRPSRIVLFSYGN